ncbi:hypothetical protein ACFX12_019467 [Malus domestica]
MIKVGANGYSGKQFGDTTKTKIFVGGLPWKTRVDTMRRYFEQFEEILEAVVLTDKFTTRSKGYGFSLQTSTLRPAPLDPIRKRTPHFLNVAT